MTLDCGTYMSVILYLITSLPDLITSLKLAPLPHVYANYPGVQGRKEILLSLPFGPISSSSWWLRE